MLRQTPNEFKLGEHTTIIFGNFVKTQIQNLKKIGQFFRFQSSPSLPSAVTEDSRQFQYRNIAFGNKTWSLVLDYYWCEGPDILAFVNTVVSPFVSGTYIKFLWHEATKNMKRASPSWVISNWHIAVFSVLYLFSETVHTRKLPLENEVLNAVYPHTSCPVSSHLRNVWFCSILFKTELWFLLFYNFFIM